MNKKKLKKKEDNTKSKTEIKTKEPKAHNKDEKAGVEHKPKTEIEDKQNNKEDKKEKEKEMEIENPKNDNNDNDNKMDICEDKKQDKEYQPYSLILRIEEPYKDISHNRYNKKYFIFYKFLL